MLSFYARRHPLFFADLAIFTAACQCESPTHIKTIATDPFEAAAFARESGVDAVAVSVGNIHRLKEPTATIDHDSLARIADAVETPLVIHGTSVIKEEDLTRMRKGAVAKFNVTIQHPAKAYCCNFEPL